MPVASEFSNPAIVAAYVAAGAALLVAGAEFGHRRADRVHSRKLQELEQHHDAEERLRDRLLTTVEASVAAANVLATRFASEQGFTLRSAVLLAKAQDLQDENPFTRFDQRRIDWLEPLRVLRAQAGIVGLYAGRGSPIAASVENVECAATAFIIEIDRVYRELRNNGESTDAAQKIASSKAAFDAAIDDLFDESRRALCIRTGSTP